MKISLHPKLKHMSLSTKLKLFISAILLPLVILICFLFATIARYTDRYDSIIKNVAPASEFNLDFKKNLDYNMYQYLISKKDFDVYAPFADVEKARKVVEKMKATTTRTDNLDRIKYIEKYLDKLDNAITKIRDSDNYDQNMTLLDKDIHVLTELIQDNMQEYIYYETSDLAAVQQTINHEIKGSIYIIGPLSILLIVGLWLLAVVTSNSITKPIKELCGNIRKVGDGDFTIRPITSNSDEIQTLSDSFNSMVGEIKDLVENIKEDQINLRATELKLLQAQITPHFLYNTLDTIIWLAEDSQMQQVMQMTNSLSNFFRMALSKGLDFISIQDEAQHVRSYLEIQQIRYRDILEYEIHIPEELYDYSVPKLTLQPLVENALYHGIKYRRGKGKIIVTGFKKEDRLYLYVEDDGVGMSDDDQTLLRQSLIAGAKIQTGFGLANVNERIQLYYGSEFGIDIESWLGQGTKVTVLLPARFKQNPAPENNQLS